MIEKVLKKYNQPSGKMIVADEDQIHEMFDANNFRDIYKKISSYNNPFCIETTKML